MQIRKVNYSFAQARKNIIRNGLMSVASLFTISSCLIILGIFTLLSLNVNHIASQVKDQCQVQLFAYEETSRQRVNDMLDEITAIENVKEATLFTKEEMLAFAENDMFEGREDLSTGFENDNPFSDSYKIVLHNIEDTSKTVSELEKIADVKKVNNEQDVVNTVVDVSNVIKKASVYVMILLIIIAIVIISNTIKITIFNRRKEINIMKYIGATDRFIRIPFVIEGVIIGFLGAVIAFGLITWGYIAMYNVGIGTGFEMFTFIPYKELAGMVAIMFTLTGCIIGMLGSVISMRKYLQV